MGKWQDQAEFVNQNARIAISKTHSPNNVMVGTSPPMMVTYYHINQSASSVDKGIQNVKSLTGETSGNRFNKIKNVPLWDMERMDLNVEEDEAGLDTTVDGTFKIPPNMFHPFPDDYFVIEHLSRTFLFRVTAVSYDTPNARGFFRCEYELWASDKENLEDVEKAVVRNYHCIYDHIGTSNKAVVSDDEFVDMHRIHEVQELLRDEYLTKFRDKAYNALMYKKMSYDQYLYDPLLNTFCNREHVFELDLYGNPDCYLLYEEKRNFHEVEYETSIFDRVSHRDIEDLKEVRCYYDMEPTENDISVFEFNKDHRVKYLMTYVSDTGPFGNKLKEYISKTFITALEVKNVDILEDPYEQFIWSYMINGPEDARERIDMIAHRRIKYSFHTFIFIPLVLYVLRQIYNNIVCDLSIMDEELLNRYSINKKGGTE